MTLSRRATSLLTGLLLLAAASHAQTTIGQPTLDEQKVQIWCATVKFVYEDTGRPNLKSRLQCGGSLKEFANSIKADSQRVYSALYQPLEGRGVMYKGLGSDNSRLQTLVREIVNRLRTSPARKGNAARLAGVTQLETALTNYVSNGTPIGELGTATAETISDTAAEAEAAPVDEATAAAPGDAGPAEAGVAGPVPAARGTGESLVNKLFGPLALILALLSLVLYALLRRSIAGFQKELSARIDKRRDEILALQNTPGTAAPAATASAERLSAAQQREIEQLVQRRVAEELQKQRNVATPAASAAVSAPAAVATVPTYPTAPAVPAVPSTVPVAPVTEAAPAPPSVASVPVETSVTMPPAPVASPESSTAPTTADEFEALVPPVHLPPAEAQPTTAQPRTRYVKVPVNGAFNEYDFSDEPQHDSIYEIYLDPQWPELATFSVTSNPAIHAYAIQSAQYSLREACRYQQPAGPVTRIITEEEGVLRKVGGNWQIEQKAGIRFE